MPVEVKTLAGTSFQLDCGDEDSIREVKEKIAARTDLPEKYTADLLKLLYAGKVLDDEKTLGSYAMKSDGFLVLVKRTPGRIPPPKKEPPVTSNIPFGQFRSPFISSMPSLLGQNDANPFHMPSFSSSQQSPFPMKTNFDSSPSASKPSFDLPSGAAQSFLSNEESDGHLQQLTTMGFDKAQAHKALQTASYDFQRALDILTGGAQPETEEKSSSLHEVVENRQTSKSSLISKNQPDPALDGDDDDEEEAQAASLGAEQSISALLRNNPQQLQMLKETLKTQNPNMAKLLDENPTEFFKMMDQINPEALVSAAGRSGGGAGAAPAGTVTVSLSPKDQEAIANKIFEDMNLHALPSEAIFDLSDQRSMLQSMGFERNQSIEAYLCCDRNEQLAANYLLSAFD